MQKFQILVFKGGHGQRKHKKEKENTCGRNEKTRREKKETTDEQMDEQIGDIQR